MLPRGHVSRPRDGDSFTRRSCPSRAFPNSRACAGERVPGGTSESPTSLLLRCTIDPASYRYRLAHANHVEGDYPAATIDDAANSFELSQPRSYAAFQYGCCSPSAPASRDAGHPSFLLVRLPTSVRPATASSSRTDSKVLGRGRLGNLEARYVFLNALCLTRNNFL